MAAVATGVPLIVQLIAVRCCRTVAIVIGNTATTIATATAAATVTAVVIVVGVGIAIGYLLLKVMIVAVGVAMQRVIRLLLFFLLRQMMLVVMQMVVVVVMMVVSWSGGSCQYFQFHIWFNLVQTSHQLMPIIQFRRLQRRKT